jgi:membrane protein YdbS with pleckstrin-like domain
MNKVSLTRYVIGVVIILAIVICIAWFIGGSAHAWEVSHFAAAFLLGMFAMYVATHVYKHK